MSGEATLLNQHEPCSSSSREGQVTPCCMGQRQIVSVSCSPGRLSGSWGLRSGMLQTDWQACLVQLPVAHSHCINYTGRRDLEHTKNGYAALR